MTSTNGIQALQLLLNDARRLEQEKESGLKKAESQLQDVFDKRRRRVKGGSKLIEGRIRLTIGTLETELGYLRQDIVAHEFDIRELQEGVESGSAEVPDSTQSQTQSVPRMAGNNHNLDGADEINADAGGGSSGLVPDQEPATQGNSQDGSNTNAGGEGSAPITGHEPATGGSSSTLPRSENGGSIGPTGISNVLNVNSPANDTLPGPPATSSSATVAGIERSEIRNGSEFSNADLPGEPPHPPSSTSTIPSNAASSGNPPSASAVPQSTNAPGAAEVLSEGHSAPILTPHLTQKPGAVRFDEPSRATKGNLVTYSRKRGADVTVDDDDERGAKRQHFQVQGAPIIPPKVVAPAHATQRPQVKISPIPLTINSIVLRDSASDADWRESQCSGEGPGSSEFEEPEEFSFEESSGSDDEDSGINLTPRPDAADMDDDKYTQEDVEAWVFKLANKQDVEDLTTTTPYSPDTSSSDMAPTLRSAKKKAHRKRCVDGGPAKPRYRKVAVRRAAKKNKENEEEEEGEMVEEEEEEEEEEEGKGAETEVPKKRKSKRKGKGKAKAAKSDGDSDSDQGSEAEALKKLPPRERWDVMSEKRRMKLTNRCRLAVQAYIFNPANITVDVSNNLCNYIREVSELCPEASFISRELALHCLTTRFQNTFCLYHHNHDKAGNINDETPRAIHSITGVPWKRDAKDRNPATPPVVRDPGILHCGCSVDDALWDFYWWKMGYIRSPITGRTEAWRYTRMEPRARGLMIQFIKDLTHLDTTDIFSGNTDFKRSKLKLLRKMEGNIHDARVKLETELQRNVINFG